MCVKFDFYLFFFQLLVLSSLVQLKAGVTILKQNLLKFSKDVFFFGLMTKLLPSGVGGRKRNGREGNNSPLR